MKSWPIVHQTEKANMRKIIVSEFLTLDSVMEDPQWAFQFQPTEDYLKVKVDELFTSDALLFGRATYEGFAAAWPSMPKDPTGYADRMNSLPKYVVSTTLKEAKWNNSTLIKENVTKEVSKLKEEQVRGNILIFGSCELVNSLAQQNLIDHYNLWVYPLVLGKGKHLFKRGTSVMNLKLIEAKMFESGVTLLRYQSDKKND